MPVTRKRRDPTRLAAIFALCLLVSTVCADTPEVAWTFRAPLGFVDSSPAVFSLAEGERTTTLVVVTTTAGSTIAVDRDSGSRVWMHGVQIPISTPPTVADVLGGPDPEVLVLNQAGQLFCLDGRTGDQLWKRSLPGEIEWGSTAIVAADLDGDRENEIVAADRDGHVRSFSGDGEMRWTYSGTHGSARCPAVGDVNADGANEVLVAGSKTPLVCLSPAGDELWRLDREGPGGSPVLADLDGDHRAEIVASAARELLAVRGDGSVAWTLELPGEVDGGICVADASRDGLPEVYVADLAGHLTAVSPRGALLWQADLGLRIRRSPAVGDIDGDDDVEVLVAGYGAELHVFDADGELETTLSLPAATNATPTITTLDGRGFPFVVVPTIAGATLAYAWSPVTVRSQADVPWPQYRSGASRRAALSRPGPVSRARIASIGFGEFHVGASEFRVEVDNPETAELSVVLEVTREERKPTRSEKTTAEKTIRARLRYDLSGRRATDVTLVCTVREDGEVVAERRHTVTVVPFRKEIADLAAAAREMHGLAEQLPGALAFEARAARLESRLPGLRERVLVTGTLEDAERRGLRDELAAALAETRRWLPVLRRAAVAHRAVEGPVILSASNPWAPFGGLDEIVEGRLRAPELEVDAFGGETESAALGVFNLGGEHLQVRVEIDPLENDGGEKRPVGTAITLRETIDIPTQMLDLAADALPKLGEGRVLVLPAWAARQLWLQIDTADLPPGAWKSRVRLRALEPSSREFAASLRIRVSPVRLPERQPLRLCHWAYVHSSRLADQPEAALRDMLEHGTNVFVTSFVPRATYDERGEILGDVDYTKHDEFVRQHARHGVILFHSAGMLSGPGAPESKAYARAHVTLLRSWVRHLRAMGVSYDGFALYPIDEPGLRDGLVERYLLFAKLARKADPKIQMYTDPVGRITMEELRDMLPYVDIWCPNRVAFLLDVGEEKMDLIRSSGKTLWTYECLGNAKHRSPLGYYRGQAWLAWYRGLTGIGFWSYCTSSADPWHVPGNTQDYLMIYQGDGVVPSKRWEAVRDGVEDYGILWKLQRAMQTAPPALRREAESLLGEEASAIARFCGIDEDGTVPGKDGLAGVRRVADRRAERIRAARRRLAELLEQLEARCGSVLSLSRLADGSAGGRQVLASGWRRSPEQSAGRSVEHVSRCPGR